MERRNILQVEDEIKIKKKRKFAEVDSGTAGGIACNPGVHCCQDPMCSAAFVYQKNLTRHAASGGHGKSDAIHTNKARKIDHEIEWKPPKERMTPEEDNMIETVQNVENQFTTQQTNHNPGNNITTI